MNHWPEADRDGIDEQVNELDHGGNAGWEGRGDLILFEPDENEEFVGYIPLNRILAIIDPVASPPWHDGSEVSEDGVVAAFADRRFEKQPYSSNLMTVGRRDWTPQQHEERIAWLLANPPRDPIEVEISVYGDADVDDGMHRLYAAAMRSDEAIRIRLGGFIDNSPQALGVMCVFDDLAEEVSEVVAL